MIELSKSEVQESLSSSNYKEIKPILNLNEQEVSNYWNKIFEKEPIDIADFDEDTIISEVYERSEDDFTFSLEDYPELKPIIQEIKDSDWDNLSDNEKKDLCKRFIEKLSNSLELDSVPVLEYFEGNENYCGAYINNKNTIKLNTTLLNDPNELFDTIAHETRHAYQFKRACIGETHLDQLYAYNFLNYIEPQVVNKKYVNFTNYQDQLVEAEARAFAKIFRLKEGE